MNLPTELKHMQNHACDHVVRALVKVTDEYIKDMKTDDERTKFSIVFAESTISAIASSIVATLTQNDSLPEIVKMTIGCLRGVADAMADGKTSPSIVSGELIKRGPNVTPIR